MRLALRAGLRQRSAARGAALLSALQCLTSVFNGELRMIALAPRTGVLYYVAFVDRRHVRRIISLRRANRREVKHYVKATEEDSD